MKFKPVKNLADQIADYLCQKIIHYEYKPGDRIIEKKLAEELGVSQAPVREAIRILDKYRLVELTPRHGARVTVFSESMIEWLYDVARELLCLVARRGIENGGPEDIEELGQALQQIQTAVAEKNTEDYLEAITDYAFISVRATKNPFLEQMIFDLWPTTLRIQYATIKQQTSHLEDTLIQFKKSYIALEEGQPEQAADAIRKLVDDEKKFALHMLKKLKKEIARD